jgi:hypothetical protein
MHETAARFWAITYVPLKLRQIKLVRPPPAYILHSLREMTMLVRINTANRHPIHERLSAVCTENLIRVDDVIESPLLAE